MRSRSTGIIVCACHLDGEGFRTLLGAAGGPFAAAGSFFGEAVVGFVGKYLGTADCEVARNQPTLPFNSQQGLRVYYANKVLVSLYRSPFLEQVRGLDSPEDGLA